MKEKGARLFSLDALRGFDMCFIMGGEMVVLSIASLFPGESSSWLALQMGHVAWNGFVFYDLIFPLFLFLAGVSFPFSFAKQCERGASRKAVTLKIVRRGLLLVLLGVFYNGLLQFDFDNLRYASVLGRIGLAWMFAALLYVWAGRKTVLSTAIALLLGYWALLALFVAPDAPEGAGSLSMKGSIVGYVDRLLLPGVLHSGVHDPEGLLSTLPAIVTALAGMFTGEFVRSECVKSGYKKVLVLFAAALVLLVVGYLWGNILPLNKNLWTSSFVCVAAGWSLVLFSLFYLVIDVMGWWRWSFFFRVIGLNSITIYLAQQFLDFHKPVSTLFGGLLGLLPESYYAIGYWCCYVLVCWLLLYFLYRNKVFLKV